MRCFQFSQPLSRRALLQHSACGFAGLSVAAMAAMAAGETSPTQHPLPHLRERARRVIFLFMWGGPSHVDLFDYKPRLNDFAGKPVTSDALGGREPPKGNILGSPFKFRQHGEGGVWISELFPHLAQHADRLCVIRSMHTERSEERRVGKEGRGRGGGWASGKKRARHEGTVE